MKKIKDLTHDQVIEIANLVYPSTDLIRSEMIVRYQPYDESWLNDAREYWLIKFDGITFGDKIDTYRLWIYPNLNLEFDAIRTNPKNMTEEQKLETVSGIFFLGTFPIRNQYLIQRNFMEWGINPEF